MLPRIVWSAGRIVGVYWTSPEIGRIRNTDRKDSPTRVHFSDISLNTDSHLPVLLTRRFIEVLLQLLKHGFSTMPSSKVPPWPSSASRANGFGLCESNMPRRDEFRRGLDGPARNVQQGNCF